MAGHMLTQSLYPIKKNVELLGNLILQLNNQRVTHMSGVVAHCAHYNGIGYTVHGDLSACWLPFEELSEEWFHEGEI